MKVPKIKDYVGLQDDVKEELRKRKLDVICKQFPDKIIIVTTHGQVFIQK